MSYCDYVCRPSCIVRRARASSVVRRQNLALNDNPCYNPGLIDSKLGRRYRGDLSIENYYNCSDQKSNMAATAAILKIYYDVFFLLNQKAS